MGAENMIVLDDHVRTARHIASAEGGQIAAVDGSGWHPGNDAEGGKDGILGGDLLVNTNKTSVAVEIVRNIAIDGGLPCRWIELIEGRPIDRRIHGRKDASCKRVGESLRELRRRNGNEGRARGALAEALIGDGGKGAVGNNAAACPETELVLLERRLEAYRVEEVARVEHRVADKLPCGGVECVGAGFGNDVHNRSRGQAEFGG